MKWNERNAAVIMTLLQPRQWIAQQQPVRGVQRAVAACSWCRNRFTVTFFTFSVKWCWIQRRDDSACISTVQTGGMRPCQLTALFSIPTMCIIIHGRYTYLHSPHYTRARRACSIHTFPAWIPPPFPQIDIIGAMVIVWRERGKIISCSVQYCVQQLYTVNCTHI